MARREDEFYRRGQNPDEDVAAARRGVAVSRPARPAEDDEIERRAVDLDEAEDSPFLRGQKRVPVRRGPDTRKAASRIRLAAFFVTPPRRTGTRLCARRKDRKRTRLNSSHM